MKHALAVLTGIAVGMPAMAALASVSGHTAGGLPDRYVPWARARHHVDSRYATLRAPLGRRARPAARRAAEQRARASTHAPAAATRPASVSRATRSRVPPTPLSRTVPPHAARTAHDRAPEPTADLRLTIAAPPTVRPGGVFVYRVRLANHGPGTPSAMTIRTILPRGVERTASTLPDGVGGYAGGREATLVMPRLAPGRSATARFDVRVRRGVHGDLVARSRIAHVEGVRIRRRHGDASTVSTRVE